MKTRRSLSAALGTGAVVVRLPPFRSPSSARARCTPSRIFASSSGVATEPSRNWRSTMSTASSLTRSWWQRAAGTSTVRVLSRRNGFPLELADIRHGPELAFILQLRVTVGRRLDSSEAPSGLERRRSCGRIEASCWPRRSRSPSCSSASASRDTISLPPIVYAARRSDRAPRSAAIGRRDCRVHGARCHAVRPACPRAARGWRQRSHVPHVPRHRRRGSRLEDARGAGAARTRAAARRARACAALDRSADAKRGVRIPRRRGKPVRRRRTCGVS